MCDPLFSSRKENKTYAHSVFENSIRKEKGSFVKRKGERKEDPLH